MAATPRVIELGGAHESDAPLIPVFSHDGTTYSMPAEVDGELSLTFIEKMAESEPAATVWLLKHLFGREGYAALRSATTKGSQLRAVADVVAEHVIGAAEGN